MVEFAYALPVLLAVGLYGAEIANLALCNLRVSQVALNLADNASRVGNTPLATQQLREVDVNDIMQAARLQGAGLDLATRGRVILSSLENVQQSYDDGPVQRLHWQRCVGQMGSLPADAAYRSGYGTAPVAAGTDASQANAGVAMPNGMGDADAKVTAPPGSGVMFVEVNYSYKPLISGYLIKPSALRVHYIASFIVRDNRDFTQIFNPGGGQAATRSTCDRYGT